eukprot:191964_1
MGSITASNRDDNTKPLTNLQLDLLITGYLRDIHGCNAHCFQIQPMLVMYSKCMTFNEYFQILMDKKPNKHIGEAVVERLTIFNQFSSTSRYYVDQTKCPKCDFTDTLRFHASYIGSGTVTNTNTRFTNSAHEYKCQTCRTYVAFNVRTRIISTMVDNVSPQIELTPCGDRQSQSGIKNDIRTIYAYDSTSDSHQVTFKPFDDNDCSKCPECNSIMVQLERTTQSTTDYGYEDMVYSMSSIKRDHCVNCDLFLVSRRKHFSVS